MMIKKAAEGLEGIAGLRCVESDLIIELKVFVLCVKSGHTSMPYSVGCKIKGMISVLRVLEMISEDSYYKINHFVSCLSLVGVSYEYMLSEYNDIIRDARKEARNG